MFADHAPIAARGGFWAAPVAALRDAYARRRVYTRTYRELNALSTSELGDLGISRCMITRLAHEAAYGKSV